MKMRSQVLTKWVNKYLNYRFAQRQIRQNKEELLQWKALKNAYKGQRCFIIGTGPSLRLEDLECLQSEITFASNRIYELFDKTDFRPTFYVNQDHNLIKTFGENIANIQAKEIFLPIDYKDRFNNKNCRFFVLKHKEFYPKQAPFSKDLTKYLAQGFTVTYGAIQIAVYMGFSEIYLLGIDHNYTIFRDAKGNPVRQEENGKNYPTGMKEYMSANALPRIEETTIAYETAEKYSRKNGFRIYNATRGGKLVAFERVNFDSIIKA